MFSLDSISLWIGLCLQSPLFFADEYDLCVVYSRASLVYFYSSLTQSVLAQKDGTHFTDTSAFYTSIRALIIITTLYNHQVLPSAILPILQKLQSHVRLANHTDLAILSWLVFLLESILLGIWGFFSVPTITTTEVDEYGAWLLIKDIVLCTTAILRQLPSEWLLATIINESVLPNIQSLYLWYRSRDTILVETNGVDNISKKRMKGGRRLIRRQLL